MTSPSSSVARRESPAVSGAGNIYDALRRCIEASDPGEKIDRVNALAASFESMDRSDDGAPVSLERPGRPALPQLVSPRDLPQRGLGSVDGRAALLHAVTHIEFNAINLALDAAYRFRAMPEQFIADWISVAVDEARHFSLLSARLEELGHRYGGFDAHDGLWAMAERTAGSVLARMALVPRVLEARGLDVTPGMIKRLRALGDDRSADILEIILAEEVRHVAIGSHWFAWCCERGQLDPDTTFIDLIRGVGKGSIRGPFNLPARREAGFGDEELRLIASLADSMP
ncbi:MAG: hypothetical protein A3E01_01340 [Gammaproteobacteria bacterium RIFCSPHIGHO2_12_FULL_63_22]|nr:MAG: hypothetical protein A3E01_01340 [Gammaproteobacteria bacterium RIFCSPHIGHO2_12_FULL_63_22]